MGVEGEVWGEREKNRGRGRRMGVEGDVWGERRGMG